MIMILFSESGTPTIQPLLSHYIQLVPIRIATARKEKVFVNKLYCQREENKRKNTFHLKPVSNLPVMKSVVFVLFVSTFLVSNVWSIVGGRDAPIEEVPYQVVLMNKGKLFGSGVVYSKDVILATGLVKDLANVSIRAGSSLHKEGGQVIDVRKVKTHPQDYDVSVLFLEKSLSLNKSVKTIDLADEIPKEGTKCSISGWGATTHKGKLSDALQYSEVDMISNEICKKSFPFKANYVVKRMICAGLKEGGADSCTGDSGAPLVCDGLVVGLSSWGIGCADKRYPGVYTSVPDVKEWVEQVIRDE